MNLDPIVDRPLKSAVCVVVGASSGIGLETARIFSENHWNVISISRNRTKLTNTVSRFSDCYPIVCDITDLKKVRQTFNVISEKYRGIDCLVNCAGLGLTQDIFSTTYDEWRNIIDTNLTGAFICTKEALNYFNPNGAIVNIGSLAVKNPQPHAIAYTASKSALAGMSEALSRDLLATQIRVILINPGLVDTLMSQHLFPNDAHRAISPRNVAMTIFFLVTQMTDVKYINVDLYGSVDLAK